MDNAFSDCGALLVARIHASLLEMEGYSYDWEEESIAGEEEAGSWVVVEHPFVVGPLVAWFAL